MQNVRAIPKVGIFGELVISGLVVFCVFFPRRVLFAFEFTFLRLIALIWNQI